MLLSRSISVSKYKVTELNILLHVSFKQAGVKDYITKASSDVSHLTLRFLVRVENFSTYTLCFTLMKHFEFITRFGSRLQVYFETIPYNY